MKIAPRTIDRFLGDPDPQIVAVLLYGPNQGLVKERADRLAAAVCGAVDDPFRSVSIAEQDLRADPGRLADERAAIAFGGGRRVIRVAPAGDGALTALENATALAEGDGLIILQAGELTPRSKLRKACEQADKVAVVACYADDQRSLGNVIRETLAEFGLSPSPDALAYLVDHLGDDRMVTRAELEKVALYAGAGTGDGGTVLGLDDVQACVGDSAEKNLDSLIHAVVTGDGPGTDRAFRGALETGAAPVAVLRAAQRLFQKLHLAATEVAAGKSPAQVVDSLRPPVIFKEKPFLIKALERWSPARAGEAMALLVAAEGDCKTSGLPDVALCHRVLLRLQQMAARGRR